jgi:hypothetical protein
VIREGFSEEMTLESKMDRNLVVENLIRGRDRCKGTGAGTREARGGDRS